MRTNLSRCRNEKGKLTIAALAFVLLAATLTLTTGKYITHNTTTTSALTQRPDFAKLPLSFELNRGQADPLVRYITHAPGGTMYFTPSEVVLAIQSAGKHKSTSAKGHMGLASPDLSEAASPQAEVEPSTSVVRLQFVGSNGDTRITSGAALPGRVNYFIGSDQSRWYTDIPTYDATNYENLYPGIDLMYEGLGRQLKGTYTVAPGTDPSLIRWRYSGADRVTVDREGNLQIVLARTDKEAQPVTVTEQAPVVWQEIGGVRLAVSARYMVAPDQSIQFVLGSYDRNHPLIIDPTLTYSTYLGGSSHDGASGIAVDAAGNTYVVGYTVSANFPLQNPFQPTYAGGSFDAFVTKFNASGSALLYSTYLGGNDLDIGYGIAVDTSGNAHVTGVTYSANFPLQNPFQPSRGGFTDAFVTKFNASGSALLYSTYLGGSSIDEGRHIAVDASDNAYVYNAPVNSDQRLRWKALW